MSKRKHFHSIGRGKKMFQYAALDGAGLSRRFPPKKKTAHAAADNVDGRVEKALTGPDSASYDTMDLGRMQDEQ